MSRRVNIHDLIQEQYYQLPKIIIWNKQYRTGLSSHAKLLYMLLKDRFNLSLSKEQQINKLHKDGAVGTFRDDNGDVYCILDNFEIAFLLDVSVKSVIKYMKEIIEMKLVESEETEGGANKYYLMTFDISEMDLDQFLGERDYFKHVEMQKKKGKSVKKTEEECIAERRKKRQTLDKSRGEKITPPSKSRGEENSPPGEENVHPRGEENPPLGEKSLHPNELDLKDPDFKDLDSKDVLEEEEETSDLIQFLLTQEVTLENANRFEKRIKQDGITGFTHKQAIDAIDWAINQFNSNKCDEPYIYAVGRLKRMLDTKVKSVSTKQTNAGKKEKKTVIPIRTELLPNWYDEDSLERVMNDMTLAELQSLQVTGWQKEKVDKRIAELQQQQKTDEEKRKAMQDKLRKSRQG